MHLTMIGLHRNHQYHCILGREKVIAHCPCYRACIQLFSIDLFQCAYLFWMKRRTGDLRSRSSKFFWEFKISWTTPTSRIPPRLRPTPASVRTGLTTRRGWGLRPEPWLQSNLKAFSHTTARNIVISHSYFTTRQLKLIKQPPKPIVSLRFFMIND